MNIGDSDNPDPVERLRAAARLHRRPERRPDCPDEDRLRMLLAPGLVDAADSGDLLAHAAACDWCGQVLREAAQDLTLPPTPEELHVAAGLKLANRRYRRKFVRRLFPPAGFFFSLGRGWQPAMAVLAVLAVGGAIWYETAWVGGVRATSRLLAQAYTARRPMEMRLPGAAYSPIRAERGLPSSSYDTALLEALLNIQRGAGAHPDDPQWLRLRGAADLLQGHYDEARAELERARALRPADPAILAGLGAAYFQIAEKSGGDPELYSKAFDVLSEGAVLQPGDPVLAFNLALAAERIKTPNVALQDWETYLRLDPRGGWTAEARQHLDNVKKNLINTGSPPPRTP